MYGERRHLPTRSCTQRLGLRWLLYENFPCQRRIPVGILVVGLLVQCSSFPQFRVRQEQEGYVWNQAKKRAEQSLLAQ
jgi:hypothetical protein